jgi:hypothetical protein
MLHFFRSLIDSIGLQVIDLGSDRVRSGRVRDESYQFNFPKKSDQVSFESGWVSRVGLDYATSS